MINMYVNFGQVYVQLFSFYAKAHQRQKLYREKKAQWKW